MTYSPGTSPAAVAVDVEGRNDVNDRVPRAVVDLRPVALHGRRRLVGGRRRVERALAEDLPRAQTLAAAGLCLEADAAAPHDADAVSGLALPEEDRAPLLDPRPEDRRDA